MKKYHIKRSRKFGGKTYYWYSREHDKRGAEREAARLRSARNKPCVRVVKRATGGYSIYTRGGC